MKKLSMYLILAFSVMAIAVACTKAKPVEPIYVPTFADKVNNGFCKVNPWCK